MPIRLRGKLRVVMQKLMALAVRRLVHLDVDKNLGELRGSCDCFNMSNLLDIFTRIIKPQKSGIVDVIGQIAFACGIALEHQPGPRLWARRHATKMDNLRPGIGSMGRGHLRTRRKWTIVLEEGKLEFVVPNHEKDLGRMVEGVDLIWSQF